MKKGPIIVFTVIFVCIAIGIIILVMGKPGKGGTPAAGLPTGEPSAESSATQKSPPMATDAPATVEKSITLSISSPLDNTTVTTRSVTVKGKTIPSAEVFVNEVDTVADKNGNFSATVALEEGENPILVVASDADGNVSEKEITVLYGTAQ